MAGAEGRAELAWFFLCPWQCFGQTPLSPGGGGGEVCLYSCKHSEELWSAFIRKALVLQCKRFFCPLVSDSPSGCYSRRQRNPPQHFSRLECPSERIVAVSRKNSKVSLSYHCRSSSQLRLRMLLEAVMETTSTAPVPWSKLSKQEKYSSLLNGEVNSHSKMTYSKPNYC